MKTGVYVLIAADWEESKSFDSALRFTSETYCFAQDEKLAGAESKINKLLFPGGNFVLGF